jgi:hypothetical protein
MAIGNPTQVGASPAGGTAAAPWTNASGQTTISNAASMTIPAASLVVVVILTANTTVDPQVPTQVTDGTNTVTTADRTQFIGSAGRVSIFSWRDSAGRTISAGGLTATLGAGGQNAAAMYVFTISGAASTSWTDTGNQTSSSAATNFNITTLANVAQADEVSIAAFGIGSATGMTTFPGTGYTQLANDLETLRQKRFLIEYKNGLTAGATETAGGTASAGTNISRVLQTYKAAAAIASSSTQDVRITGQDVSSATQDARVIGQSTSPTTQDVRVTSQASSSTEQDARITGQSSSATDQDGRAVGTIISSAEFDGRTTGQNTSSVDQDARVTGMIPRRGLITWAEIEVPPDFSVPITYDARVTGQLSSADNRDTRISGFVDQPFTQDARVIGDPHATSTTQDVRVVGAVLRRGVVTWSEIEVPNRTPQTGIVSYDVRVNGQLPSNTSYDVRLVADPPRSAATYVAKLTGQSSFAATLPFSGLGATTSTATFDARISSIGVSSDSRDVRIVGQNTATQTNDVRVTGHIPSASAQDARVVGRLDTATETTAKIAGESTSSTTRDVRVASSLGSNLELDSRVTAQSTSSSVADTRITAQNLTATIQDVRVPGIGTSISSIFDVRVAGTIATSTLYDVRVGGRATSTDERDARVRGEQVVVASFGARTWGSLFPTGSREFDVRVVGAIRQESSASYGASVVGRKRRGVISLSGINVGLSVTRLNQGTGQTRTL